MSKNAIDLHIHTNNSDGTFSTKELIDLAIKQGLKAIAITDHDTIDAIPEAMRYSKNKNIEVVPGIEISCDELKKGFKDVHILGLFIDYNNKEIIKFTEEIKSQRTAQKKEIIKKLQNLGYKISFEEIEKSVKGAFGRPHIARILLKKYPNDFSSTKEIFDKLLGTGKLAYVDREEPRTIKDAIDAIKKSNGLAFLAHPGVYKKEDSLELIKLFKSLGGDGIETYYPYELVFSDFDKNKTQDLVEFYNQVADKEGLLKSGGSDFHGDKREIELGEAGISKEEYENIKPLISKN